MEKGFAAESLRELRLKAGLTQRELAKQSDIHFTCIWRIEQGRSKPRELTWRKLLKALSGPPPDEKGRDDGQDSTSIFLGEILTREEFFVRLKPKMSEKLRAFFDGPLMSAVLNTTEFFTRRKFYPGDFSTAVEILGALLKTQRMAVGAYEPEEISEAIRNSKKRKSSQK